MQELFHTVNGVVRLNSVEYVRRAGEFSLADIIRYAREHGYNI